MDRSISGEEIDDLLSNEAAELIEIRRQVEQLHELRREMNQLVHRLATHDVEVWWTIQDGTPLHQQAFKFTLECSVRRIL